MFVTDIKTEFKLRQGVGIYLELAIAEQTKRIYRIATWG